MPPSPDSKDEQNIDKNIDQNIDQASTDIKNDPRANIFFLVFCLALFALRFYVAGAVGLGDDEAYYWDWSRSLDWSYYDHPGMTAWLIRLATLVFGQTAFAVRFFAVVCNTATAFMVWLLAKQMFGEKTARLATGFYLLTPGFSLGALLMVPDAPMGFFWLASIYVVAQILFVDGHRLADSTLAKFAMSEPTQRSRQAKLRIWALAGMTLGLGLISKYTIALLAISFVGLFSSHLSWRQFLARRGFWLTVAISATCCFPIIYWNTQRGWPTFWFHLHDRQTGGGGANLDRWLQFWVSQIALLTPPVFCLVIAALVTGARRLEDARWRFMIFCSVPVLALFYLQALFAEFKPHWPMPAYVVLFIGAAELMVALHRQGKTRSYRLVLTATLLFLVPLNTVFYAGTLYPVVPKVAKFFAPAMRDKWDPKFDPTNDLYGWEQAAQEVRALQEAEFAKTGRKPFLASSRYQLTAQLAFATQYEVWRVSPTKDEYSFIQSDARKSSLVGQDAIYVVDNRYKREPERDGQFADCTEQPQVPTYRHDEIAHVFFYLALSWIQRALNKPTILPQMDCVSTRESLIRETESPRLDFELLVTVKLFCGGQTHFEA